MHIVLQGNPIVLQRALRAILEIKPALLPADLRAPKDQPQLLAATHSLDALQHLMAEHAGLASVLLKFQSIGPAHPPPAVAGTAPQGKALPNTALAASGGVDISGVSPHFPAASGKDGGLSAPQQRPGSSVAVAVHRPPYQVLAQALNKGLQLLRATCSVHNCGSRLNTSATVLYVFCIPKPPPLIIEAVRGGGRHSRAGAGPATSYGLACTLAWWAAPARAKYPCGCSCRCCCPHLSWACTSLSCAVRLLCCTSQCRSDDKA